MSSIDTIRSLIATDPSIEMRTKKTLLKCFDELDFAVSLPISVEDGGTGGDLSATGDTSFVVMQEAPGDDFTVRQLAGADLSDANFGSNDVLTSGAVTAGTTVTATGKVLTTAGLGVGNSAAATSLGTVVKKMQVFNASGVSLGFIAIYDAIT